MGTFEQFGTASFSLLAVAAWGASDFVGGYASRRANAFFFTAIAHLSGMLFMGAIAVVGHAPIPTQAEAVWSLAAGAVGGVSLALFYKSLSSGKMGLMAPVAAVLGAGIPTIFSLATEGFPGVGHVFGFVLAGVGVWLISRPEVDGRHPEGLALAMVAGIGFAGFYILIRQAGEGSALWTATISRCASFAVTSAVVVAGGHWRGGLGKPLVALAVSAGVLDISGTMVFIRASQAGRLDEAVVLSSLYPVVTVLLARVLLREHFTRWKLAGMLAALAAVPMIAGR